MGNWPLGDTADLLDQVTIWREKGKGLIAESPTLFVDFDGVLHPYGITALDENFKLIANPTLFCWRPILENVLAPHPNVQIIVSSDWRRLFPDEVLVALLGPKLEQHFSGAVDCYNASRVEEILDEASRRRLSRWLAIDDHPSVREACRAGDERFVVCNPDSGISDVSVQSALRRKLAALRN